MCTTSSPCQPTRCRPLFFCAQAKRELCEFFFTATVALQHIDNRHLRASFGILGVDLPSRKTLSGRILNERYTEVSAIMPTVRRPRRWGDLMPLPPAQQPLPPAQLPLLQLPLLMLLLTLCRSCRCCLQIKEVV
jgi:hypothetical protein